MTKKLLFPLLSILFLLGCKEEEEGLVTELTTNLPDNKISFPSASPSISNFTIESNSIWGIYIKYPDGESNQNWLQISQIGGNIGKTQVTIRVDSNYIGKERNGEIIIISEDKEISINVNQTQKNVLESVSNKYISVPREGGVLNVKFNSNVDAVLISKPEWVENSTSRSITEKEDSFAVSQLVDGEEYGRSGEIVYKDQNTGDSLSYSVSQGYAIHNTNGANEYQPLSFHVALETIFGKKYPFTLTKLKVTGILNQMDLMIFSNMLVLEDLDISKATIVGDINIGTVVPNKGDAIPANAFTNSRIKSIQLPNVTHIGAAAFQGCSLSELIIPNSVLYIGMAAFQGCSLSELIIPSSVVYIGEGAFMNCNNLDEIAVSWDNSEQLPMIEAILDYNFLKDNPDIETAKAITIPKNSSAIYQTKGWEKYNTVERLD